eukprot:g1438.t1
MNGNYVVASGDKIGVKFNVDYASKGHEFFDVYSPELATHYGEVFWTDQGNNPIPQDIIDRFKGKTIAITGYEFDQVMVIPTGEPGKYPEEDVSVPINWAYDHHYMMWMTGTHSYMDYFDVDPHDVSAHGAPMRWKAVEKESAILRDDPSIPVSQFFSEGNGGEARKSFHGYPNGFAQLIESPNLWHITPMQIDTRNRDCGVTPADINNCTTFTPGPEPKQARYGRGIPAEGTNYSGILECPCTSRYGGDPVFYGESTKTKIVTVQYKMLASGTCRTIVADAVSCFNAVVEMNVNATKWSNRTVDDATMPSGCLVITHASGEASAIFNTASSDVVCPVETARSGGVASPTVGVSLSLDIKSDVTIEISGPVDAWFGVGFNAQKMADMPYTLIVNSTNVVEQKIGTCGSEADHCPGTQLASTVQIVSNTVEGNLRRVVLTRALVGATGDHYSFNATSDVSIPLVMAVGSSQTFAYHKAHDVTSVALTTPETPTCVCENGRTGKICETNGTNCNSFVKNCVADTGDVKSSGVLLSQDNPTCNSVQYSGGLTCCAHKRILLDADQEVRPELLRYHMKFRFWFQEYVPANATHNASHLNLDRIYQQTEANAGEYDIPPAFRSEGDPQIPGYADWPVGKLTPGTTCEGTCPNGPDCKCFHEIVYNWTISETRLIYAGGHCHAPSCIGIWLYRNDPGHEMELLCHQRPVYGTGNVTADKYDEAGYLSLPPCLWGDDEGLEASQFLPKDTPVVSIKKNWNTHMGHYGEMASWQMRGVGV